jgi:hypothetical protein
MGSGNATKKITATIEEDRSVCIQSLVSGGKAKSILGFVHHAVSVALDIQY